MPYQNPLSGQNGNPRKLTEAKNTPTAPRAEYFMRSQRYNFGFPYPTPYMDTPEARGSSRNLKYHNPHVETKYFPGGHRYNFGLPCPTPLHGRTGWPRKLAEARGS